MSDGQNYPSPDEAHLGSQGPFYGRPVGSEQNAQPQDEIADDLQLRAALARGLGPLADATQSQIDESLLQDPSAYQHHLSASSQLGLHDGSPVEQGQASAGKSKPPRNKVSKACDQCRKKKIRCDISVGNDGVESCSNCRRLFQECTFSREQLKRGPSKGYIKELADRLKAIEEQSRLQQMPNDLQFMQDPALNDGNTPQRLAAAQSQPFATPQQPSQVTGQKRPYEVMSRESSAPSAQQGQLGSYQQTPATSHSTAASPSEHRQNQSPGRGFQPFFKYGAEPPRQPVSSAATDVNTEIFDWDEEVVDEYYQLIHQTFPLLPHSKTNLRIRISACPAGLKEAFVTTLGCMMRTFPSSKVQTSQSYASNLKRAAELIAGYPFDDPPSHTPSTDLVYLQTLLLMAMICDNFGPATVRGQAGPSQAEWLGRAAGVAAQLEINLVRPRERLVTEGDPDSEERLARRVWWVLFILDRWHSCSRADLLKLPENSVVLLPEDQMLLGEATYHLARLSFIIGHLASILTTTKTPETNVMAPSNPASYLLGMALTGEIDRFRESVESVWGSFNLVHLSYHHSHLLIKRLNPSSEPTELISHALKVATVLNQRQTPLTPLNHHFGALAAMTLCELVDVPRTAADAARGLDQLAEALGSARGLAGHPSQSSGWDEAIRDLVRAKRARLSEGNGERTKEVMTSADGNVAATAPAENGLAKFDPTPLTMYGYLTALGQGKFQT